MKHFLVALLASLFVSPHLIAKENKKPNDNMTHIQISTLGCARGLGVVNKKSKALCRCMFKRMQQEGLLPEDFVIATATEDQKARLAKANQRVKKIMSTPEAVAKYVKACKQHIPKQKIEPKTDS